MGVDPTLRAVYDAEEEARMATFAELQYAQQRGIEQGSRSEQQRLLLNLLTRRIGGDIPPSVATRLAELPAERVDALIYALFDLRSYADIEVWLSRA